MTGIEWNVNSETLAILGYAVATVWWASNISTTLGNMLKALIKIDNEFEKRDLQIGKIWERVDDHSKRIASHEAKIENLGG